MGHLGPLRSALFRLRKRKNISLDGLIPGLDVNRYRSGLGSSDPGHHLSPSPADQYDPDPGPIEDTSSEYHQPDAWFDQQFPGTPQERFRSEPQVLEERLDLEQMYQIDSAILQAIGRAISEGGYDPGTPDALSHIVEFLWQDPLDQMSPDELYELGVAIQTAMERQMQETYHHDIANPAAEYFDTVIQDIQNAMDALAPDYEDCQMTDELFEQQMAQALEAQQPEPEPEPDPYMLQQQQFDQMMQYMANPFNMPGPMGG